jgi:hypothetical protein
VKEVPVVAAIQQATARELKPTRRVAFQVAQAADSQRRPVDRDSPSWRLQLKWVLACRSAAATAMERLKARAHLPEQLCPEPQA